MKKYIKYIIGVLILSGSIQSCSEYLEEANPNSTSADVYWSNLDETNENLTAVYSAMLNHFIYFFEIESWRSDIAYPKSRFQPYVPGTIWYNQNFTNTNREVSQRWDAIYQVIFRANQVIGGLEGLGDEFKSSPRWTEQMAQARFFRGLGHFYLSQSYNKGNIIIRKFVPGNTAEFSIPVSTAEEVTTFYRDDLQYAYDNLPAKFQQKTRVSAGIAAFVLGQSYLYSKDYSKAKEYLTDVIQNSAYGYQLLEGDNVKLMFTSAGDFNTESIFELNYSDKQQIEESQWDEESFFTRWARFSGPTGTFGSSAYFVPSAWLADAYSHESLDTNDSRNYVSDGAGGVKLRSLSLRASQMVALVNDEETEYYKITPGNEKVPFGNTTFAYFKHFTNHDIAASENDVATTAWKSGKNVVLYRLADAYLMVAECILEDGGTVEDALKYINPIRKRWALELLKSEDFTTTTLMEHIMYKERPLELSLEGFSTRVIDLRRWGVAKSRFQELSNLDFHLVDYTSTNGKKIPFSLVKPGVSPTPADNKTVLKEYVEAATNYNEDLHGYFPLPLSELLNNQQVKN